MKEGWLLLSCRVVGQGSRQGEGRDTGSVVLAEPKAHKVEGEPESAGVHVQGFMRGMVGSGNDPGGQDQGQS